MTAVDAPASRFAVDTAVTRRDVDRFDAECRAGWRVIGDAASNGGYLMALAARAMAERAERPDPVTVTAHFLTPPELGPLEVITEMIREGGRHRTVAARVLQDGRECVRLLGTFGDLTRSDGPSRVLRRPPPWPDVDTLDEPLRGAPRGMLPEFLGRLHHRMPEETSGWTRGRPSGAGVHGGWCRWSDGYDFDSLALLCVADAYPPVVYDLDIGDLAWAPTIELTVQVRGRPSPGWLATRFTTQALTGGYFEEDGDLWDSEGRLVALSRQIALAGGPPRR